jgi:pilus assembly protein Flp/PilA
MMDRLNSLAGEVYLAITSALRREEGQAITEYALVLALIALVAAGVLVTLGTNIRTDLTNIATRLAPGP